MVSILVCQAWRAASNPVQSFPVSCKADRCGNIALAAELSAVNRMVAGSNPAVPALWSFVQWQGTCLIRSLRGFDSRSSDHASLAQQETRLICNQRIAGSNPAGSSHAGIVQGPVLMISNHLISVRIRVSASRVSGTEYHFSFIH